MEAPDLSFARAFFQEDDANEVFIAVNELAFHLSSSSSSPPQGEKRRSSMCQAFFWVDWMIGFDAACRKNKNRGKKFQCARRPNAYIDQVHQLDSIWLVWDCFFHSCVGANPATERTVRALHRLFSIDYRPCVAKKRRHLLHFLTLFFFETRGGCGGGGGSGGGGPRVVLLSPEKKLVVASHLANQKCIYRQIKRAEKSPKTEYLFSNLRQPKTEFEKSISKMHILNQQDESQNKTHLPIPATLLHLHAR